MDFKPQCTDDIEHAVLFSYKNHESTICIGSKKIDKYFFIPESDLNKYLDALKLMNGEKTIDQIKQSLSRKYNTDYVDNFYKICLQCGFILNYEGRIKPEFTELHATYIEIASVRIIGLASFFSRIPKFLCMATLFFAAVTILLSIFLFPSVLLVLPWDHILSNAYSILYLLCISTFSVLFHELGHIFIASKLGVALDKAVLSTFSFLSFGCYARLPGIYFLEPRKRIWIWGAGAFVNLFLSAVGVIVFALTSDEYSNLHLWCSMIIISNLSLVLSALVPFYISDGYFILSTLCKKPNLRKNMFLSIRSLFSSNNRSKAYEFFNHLYALYYFVYSVHFSICALVWRTFIPINIL